MFLYLYLGMVFTGDVIDFGFAFGRDWWVGMDESGLGIIYGGNKKQNFLKTRLVSEFVSMPYIINDVG